MVLIIIGMLGLSVYLLGKSGFLGVLEPHTLDRILTKILLPAMFFSACIVNNHVVDHVGSQVAFLYIEMLCLGYAILYIGMWCFAGLRVQSAQYAMQLCSNHVMLVAAPLAGLVLGIDAMPVIIVGMLTQVFLIILSVLLDTELRGHALEIISRYYQQSLPVWWAIVLGLLGAYCPWNEGIQLFFNETFEWLCLFNVLFAIIIMAVKSLSIQHSLMDSSVFYIGKLIIVMLLLLFLQLHDMVDDVSLVLLAMMMVSPGMMIKDYVMVHEKDTCIYWKQIIAGCNIWYMIMMVVVGLLPLLWN